MRQQNTGRARLLCLFEPNLEALAVCDVGDINHNTIFSPFRPLRYPIPCHLPRFSGAALTSSLEPRTQGKLEEVMAASASRRNVSVHAPTLITPPPQTRLRNARLPHKMRIQQYSISASVPPQ
jgi:hypothetical protein